MKKLVLVTAVSLLAACSSSPFVTTPTSTVATTEGLVGDWECRMEGGVATSNKVSLGKDGKAIYVGKAFMPTNNPVFQYDIKRTGTWAYANNTLTYKFGKGSVARAHSDEIQQALKTDAELNSSEKEYYDILNKQMTKATQTTINLAVSNFAQHSFTIQQKMGDTVRTGHCVRP